MAFGFSLKAGLVAAMAVAGLFAGAAAAVMPLSPPSAIEHLVGLLVAGLAILKFAAMGASVIAYRSAMREERTPGGR